MNLSKLNLIFQREYITRIRTKTFIFTTLLAPFFMLAVLIVPVLLIVFTSDRERTFEVIDNTGVIYERLAKMKPDGYRLAAGSTPSSLRARVIDGSIDGFIFINEGVLGDGAAPDFFHDGSAGFSVTTAIR
ncbi:MAG: hypothetical protein WDZ53_05065, partial [Balneolales bacterium]